MASKGKNFSKKENNSDKNQGIINGAGEIVEQEIANTLEQNYMPYAMSVILSRAIPQIDGFKPSHRKLLYTMYKMGLLNSARTKSANIVGQTMKLNPHGDSAIYDTMVRLSRGYEALLHPYVDSKGNFGKFYSRDMMCAASRYTEARLDDICEELFKDIEKDTVDFVDNYDNTLKEPTLLPASFPSILVNANTGIAVGMASSICPFNLREVCKATIMLIKNPDADISKVLLAPDFTGGGIIIYDEKSMMDIYETGRGSIKVRARYTYDKTENCIDISSIPPTTTSEAIIEKVIEMVKKGVIKEISDVRDETGIDGLKITIDLKRNTDAEKLMQKLYRLTPLEDSFSCNFNVLINGTPKVLGVKALLEEWLRFRLDCVKRRIQFDLSKQKSKMHLLTGLKKILVDIDKAIEIIRNTKEESQVVPNLMAGFSIDELQADYVAEIKLRHLNREYILKRTDEIEKLKESIEKLEAILNDENKVKEIIAQELCYISEKYGKPRKTMLIYKEDIKNVDVVEEIPEYPVHLFLTKNHYFKKITPQSLRMNSEQKLKDGDEILQSIEANNTFDLLFFTDKHQVYKAKVVDFQDIKASVLGEFIPAKLGMEPDESILYMVATGDYSGNVLFFFENGKVAQITLDAYKTKTNRKKLINAFSDKSKVVAIEYLNEEKDFLITSSSGRMLILNTSMLQVKSTKTTLGVSVMSLRKGHRVIKVAEVNSQELANERRYRPKNLPAAGSLPSSDDMQAEQLVLQ